MIIIMYNNNDNVMKMKKWNENMKIYNVINEW